MVNDEFIPMAVPVLGQTELDCVSEAVKSGWISAQGRYVAEFEDAFSRYCGVRYGIAVTSGTTALHLALAVLGIGPGDEVIIPPITHIAVANMVTLTGVKPVLVDCEPHTWNMDPDQVEAKTTDKTKVILPVHLYGHPVDMGPILELAEKYALYVVEDAAEAHGAEYRGCRTGSLGYMACFSSYANKIITTGEGGMITTDDPDLAARAVEIPWVLARLAHRTGWLLDAGSSLNHEFVLRAPVLANMRITIVTLAPEAQCHWRLGISYVFGDLRDLDFRDGRFDAIVCISTIEHVAMDNWMYAGAADMAQPGDTKEFLLAVKELKRVLKPGGLLYIAFPFGRYENHGWFQQFDSQLMDTLIEEFGPRHFNEIVFRYDPDGWKLSDRASCGRCRYFDIHTSKCFDPNSTIEYPPDYPAGERAVACLELFK